MSPLRFSTDVSGSLTGYLLIASPQMVDSRFTNAVILICGHDHNGAMGLVLNRVIEDLTLKDLFEQLEVAPLHFENNLPIHFGGPIEMGRGFMLHSCDFLNEHSLKITSEIALTSTVEILNLVAEGKGPQLKLLALGYAGWSAGQLENELQENSWLQVESDQKLVFNTDLSKLWLKALEKIGINPTLLSLEVGHA